MNIENFKQLKDQLYKKGFAESLYPELEQQLQSGKAEFFLEQPSVKIKEDEVAYRLHFRRDNDPAKDKVYFNSFDVMLFKSPDLKEGEVRQHNFPAKQLISATEAHRMLKYGELVAVNKNLFNKANESYNAWLTIDLNAPKNEFGNYLVHYYHGSYYKEQPFNLSEALQAIPVPVRYLDRADIARDFEKQLMKANLVSVTIQLNGQEQKALLSVDAKAGKVNLLDQNLQRLDLDLPAVNKEHIIDIPEARSQSTDEKKKTSGQQQKVNWSKPAQRKGLSQ